ncbi:MAG: DNA topoisomerase IV subunit A, partial [Anaeroplasmataceae bacterium]
EDVLGDRFGRYSKYIIQERAIPDVRDGLKPVQRRILYGMHQMGINSTSPYKKSARICGEVMGKYHPHGDSSIYEAMVRMSQDWKMGVKLIDMHGNNGSIDGDGAAAMRYTETRLSKNADYLLKDINKNTVPFILNFDEEETEPTVLPAQFPNLLVNGGMGISSGYATYIPTHNIVEVINATIAKIDNPNLSLDQLLEIMPGPDFPTGGIVQGIDDIREAFNTGSGSIIVRSKVFFEDIDKESKRIVITEIPFDTVKAKTVEKIDQIRIDNRIEGIAEVRDESDREGLRIAIDLKKNANETAILNYLFKNTDLQVNIKYNMVAINNLKPERMGVIRILDAYLEHQKVVMTNKTNFDLSKDTKRLHIVDGLIKMISVVDKVIKIIRASKNKADSKVNIQAKFGFTEIQAEAIVMMQLYKLSNQDIVVLQNEQNELKENIINYNKILNDTSVLLSVIKSDLESMKQTLNVPRRTVIESEISEIKIDESDLILKEQVNVCVTKEGFVKKISTKSFALSKINTLKENDSFIFSKEVSTLDTLLMFTNLGNFIYLPVFKIEECKTKDTGAFINTLVTITPGEKIINVFNIEDFKKTQTVLLATKLGSLKQCELSNFELSRYSKAVKAFKLAPGDSLVSVDISPKPYEIIICTNVCDVLRIRSTDINMFGTNAGGIKGCNLAVKEFVVSAFYANMEEDILLLTDKNSIKRMRVTDISLTKRLRSTTNVIKKVKSNPTLLLDAKKISHNQYKENVSINLIFNNGNSTVKATDFKYNQGEIGLKLPDFEFDNLIKFSVDQALTPDKIVDYSYLLEKEVVTDLFSVDEGIENEVSIKSKKKDTTQDKLLSNLDEILKKEGLDDKPSKEVEINAIDQDLTNYNPIIDKTVVNTQSSTIVRKSKDSSDLSKLPKKNINLFEDDDK